MTSSRQDNSHCPICERFIGNELICPFCDIKTRNFRTRAIILTLALTSAIIGIIYLALYSFYNEDNFVNITEITRFMNYATISTEGTIKTVPYTIADVSDSNRLEYFSFILSSNDKEIRVAYSPKPEKSILKSELPEKGTPLRVVDGVVGIGKKDGQPRIYIQDLQQLTVPEKSK
jgi:hypothetical protein